MASIENLKLQVTADISKAIAELERLEEKLQDIAEAIEMVDSRGAEGIDIRTDVDQLDTELASMQSRIEAFEAANKIELETEVERGLAAAPIGAPALPAPDVGENTRMAENVIPEEFAAMAEADVDFGDFNVPREGGIDIGDDDGGMVNLGPRVRKLKRRFSNLGDRMSSFRLRMSDIHNLFASLIPMLFIFVGALPAVITAIYGLAAAAVTAAASLAAIAGLGALGMALEGGQIDMDNLTDVWEDLKQGFIEAFAPLAESLQPLFEDAVDGAIMLFEAIAAEGDALKELTDEARAFGGFVMDFLPGALRTLASLVEALSPLLSDIGAAIDENFSSFVRQLVYWTEQAVPVVAALVQTIIKALPTIIDIGIQFAFVANVALQLIGVFWRIITLNGLLADGLGILIGVLLLAASAFSLLSTFIGTFVAKALMPAIISVYRFMTAIAAANTQMTLFGSTAIVNAISGLISFTAGIIQSIVALTGFSISAYQAAIAAAAFWTAVTIGLALPVLAIVSGMAAEFLGLSNSIDQATNSLKEFDRVSRRTSGGDINPYGGQAPSSGAGAANGGGGKTVINIESSGDPNEDSSNARYVSFRQGRTTGGGN